MRQRRETLQNHRMTEVLAICGSLRKSSSNLRLLRAAAAVAPFAMTFYEKLGELPHFNPDLDLEGMTAPPPVAEWRALVQRADALVISTPEYAHGLPGTLKNALDWLVSSPAMIDQPVAVLSASARSTFADASLRETLRTMSARIIDAASVTIENPSDESALRAAMEALAHATGDLRQ